MDSLVRDYNTADFTLIFYSPVTNFGLFRYVYKLISLHYNVFNSNSFSIKIFWSVNRFLNALKFDKTSLKTMEKSIYNI